MTPHEFAALEIARGSSQEDIIQALRQRGRTFADASNIVQAAIDAPLDNARAAEARRIQDRHRAQQRGERPPEDHTLRASSDGKLVQMRSVALATAPTESKLVTTQIAEIGSWKGHPSGPFEMTPETFDQIVRNWKRDGSLPIPVDFEHASESDPTEGNIATQGAPAIGWVRSLQNRGTDGLWGEVEWLEPAKSLIKEGRYKFLSPAIRFGAKDRVSGKEIGARLSSVGLTNSPFLRSMEPLTAKDRAAPTATTLSAAARERVAAFAYPNDNDRFLAESRALQLRAVESENARLTGFEFSIPLKTGQF